MASSHANSLDDFLPLLPKNDTKFRQQVGTDLLAFLAEPSNSINCQDIGQFIDSLIPWMQSSNYKVSNNGIEILTYLADRLGHDFRPYTQTVLPCVIDRLGDAKDTVREKSQLLILKLLEREVLTPQSLLDKLTTGFSHKNSKIREEVLRCLVNTINEHGAQSVTLSKFIPHIVKLLSDPSLPVRDTAFSTLVELYKHVGEKMRLDLERRNLVPASKLQQLTARFDEVRNSGELLATASTNNQCVDEVDRMYSSKSATLTKKTMVPPIRRCNSNLKSGVSSSATAGAVDEDIFVKQFMDVPTIQLFTAREVNEQMKNVLDTISDTNKDWDKRAEALKKLRSLIIAGAATYEEFYAHFRNLEFALQASIKDLRSQVVREACITIAFMSQSLGNKFDHAAESLLTLLINLIQNSAKIMATSGLTCVRFIIQHTHNSRLIPLITSNLQNSKSKEIRKSCCEFLEFILGNWPSHLLEKHVAILQESVKKGISDADPEARGISRRAFKGFRDKFPEQADALLLSLEPSYRKALQNELSLSSSSSSGSLTHASAKGPRYKNSNLIQAATDGKKGFRSNSAIDLQAVQRARARAQYSAMARQKVACGTATLPRPKKSPESVMSPERLGRSRNRSSGVSQSQPTSRSGSPSSRLPYYSGRTQTSDSDSPRPRRLSSGIPRSITGSREVSRETSPTRGYSLSRYRRNSDRPPLGPLTRGPVMAQKILQQSREAESALADALSYDHGDYQKVVSSPRKIRSIENHSDDSETSSICSERSYDSYKRPSDSYSWSGSQSRLTSYSEASHDINTIIALCASTNWQERREGLTSLQRYLLSGSLLSPGELKHTTEIFTKVFMDSHTKGMCLFLDTINELINRHKADLHDWLYILLQRIFYKMGTDLLATANSKLCSTLENVRKSFPIPLQLPCIYKILTDVAQRPATKVKIAILEYLTSIYKIADANHLVTKPPMSKAFEKILSYAYEGKYVELREAAKICIIAMWNCNIPLVTMMLNGLPKHYQDIATHIVQKELARHNDSSNSDASPSNSLKNMSSRDEIFKSLQKTSTEIQNYSFETVSSRDSSYNKSDSPNAPSSNDDSKTDVSIIEEGMEQMQIHQNYNKPNSGGNAYTINGVNENDSNGHIGHTNSLSSEEIVTNVLNYCILDNPLPASDKLLVLEQLLYVVAKGDVGPVIENFKKLLRIFIDILSQKEAKSTVIVLKVLGVIFENAQLEECWGNFIELLTLRVLEAFSHDDKAVRTTAEATAGSMSLFPFDTVVNVLAPLIQTTPFPKMNGAIKMITRLIEKHPEKLNDEHLNAIMPGLVKANDHDESVARKSAVFCMVAIHRAVGEERLGPHIKTLSGSKLKLLKLYIDKTQQDSTRSSRHTKTS